MRTLPGTWPAEAVLPAAAPGIAGPAAAAPFSATPRRTLPPNATIVARIDVTASIARFVVRPDDGVPAFRPGQYFAIGVEVNDRTVERPYSATSLPGDRDLEFLVRLVPGGALTPAMWRLAPGDRLHLGRPKGLFRLRPDAPKHVMIATGTGIAPFVSMTAALPVAPEVDAVLVHGASFVSELAYAGALAQWAAVSGHAYVPAISRPSAPENRGWNGAIGRIDCLLDGLCERYGLEPARTVAYLCGNPEMIEAVRGALAARGFPDASVVVESYWSPTTARASGAQGASAVSRYASPPRSGSAPL